MPSKRSPAKLAEREMRNALLSNVRKREASVARREVRVGRREHDASDINEHALLLAEEAAKTCTTATELAAHHLVEDVGVHADELMTSAKMSALAQRPPAVASAAPHSPSLSLSVLAVHEAVGRAPLSSVLGVLGKNEVAHNAAEIIRIETVRARRLLAHHRVLLC